MYHFPVKAQFEEEHEQQVRAWECSKLEDLLEDSALPIGTNAHLRIIPNNGVVKIENIPYTVTRLEISQFFGRGCNLVAENPVHIIMERSTGKTMECYVEFMSQHDAQAAVTQKNRGSEVGPGPKMGMRHVEITMSSTDELMEAIFPLAKCTRWQNGQPIRTPRRPDEHWSTGFTGFLTDEELFCNLRHAENPTRGAFSSKVPQRCYESMVTTISKYPWTATNLYTVQERNSLFRTLRFMIEALVQRMECERVVGLSNTLVLELVHVGLRCPGFNPRMKFCLAYVGRDSTTLRRMSEEWLSFFPFDTLTWLPPHNPYTLGFYGSLIARGSANLSDDMGLTNQYDPRIDYLLEPYGRIWYEWDESKIPGGEWSFADCIDYEKSILRMLITTGFNNATAPNAISPTSSVSTIRNRTPLPGNYAGSNAQPGIQSTQIADGTSISGVPLNERREEQSHTSSDTTGRHPGRGGGRAQAGGGRGTVEWRRSGNRRPFSRGAGRMVEGRWRGDSGIDGNASMGGSPRSRNASNGPQ